jgi:tetratricopeptide (TPR) repeat protein
VADLRDRLQVALRGRYTIERELGRGGMAIVFLARDHRHDRDVALKVLRPELAASLGPDRFLLEIRVAAGLTHPHIVPLHDSGDADGCLYYVMPFLQGESLRDRLERDGALPVAEAVELARDVADALDYAHRQGVVHRDIKPENILLQDGHALVADFGIARAISAARGGSRRVTASGVAVGTPDYMSPEQERGEEQVDGRSDIYSLGLVLHEMLTGRTPETGVPVTLSNLPAGVPPDVRAALRRSLAPRAAERYQTAGEMSRILTLPSGAYPAARRRRWMTAAAALLVCAGAGLTLLPRLLGAGVDRSLYVVVPFRHRGAAAPELLDGDQCELRLYEELGHWADVKLVNELLLHDARSQVGHAPATLEQAVELARRVGAGRMIWGEVSGFRDSIQVNAILYDVARGSELRRYGVPVNASLDDATARFRELADSLLLEGSKVPPADAGSRGTRSLSAFLAYDSGHAALARWDLPAAAAAFDQATQIDSTFPQANLWLAQVRDWRGAPAAEWSGQAALAAAAGATLGARDRLRAEALDALATARYDQACERYRRLVALDSTDFAAWFGLGECEARDRTVVRAPGSPSGWAFRGSYHAAARAYERAFRLNPSAHHAFVDRVPDLLYMMEPNYLRSGRPLPPDTGVYVAFPSIAGDSLAFVPFPIAAVQSGRADTRPATAAAAVLRNREVVRRIADDWVRRFPTSADALETLAWAQETTGDLGGPGDDQRGALAAVRRARRAVVASPQQLRLAVDEVRLLLKVEDYGAARRLADSLLAAAPHPAPADAGLLAGLAALTGRTARAAELLRLAVPGDRSVGLRLQPLSVSPSLIGVGRSLLAYAALGAPADSILALEQRLEILVRDSVRPDRRAEARDALLGEPAVLAYPAVGAQPAHAAAPGASYLLDLQARVARGDTGGARGLLGQVAAMRRGVQPGDVAIDGTYQEAWLRLQLGDSAAARAQLDSVLNALRSLGTQVVTRVPEAASLVRAMALRADLAAAAGDKTAAQWWGQRVVLLWSDADGGLRPLVSRMRTLAGN